MILRRCLATVPFLFAMVAATTPCHAAGDAGLRASAGILKSRNAPLDDRIGSADALARNWPVEAVPLLVEALNDAAEPIRRAAAAALWTVAAKDDAAAQAAARNAMPALRTALDDASAAVAMNAAGALDALDEPKPALAPARRAVLATRAAGPYVRFLAARGLIGIDPADAVAPPLVEFLYAERLRRDSRESSGAGDNVQLALRALERLAATGDPGLAEALRPYLGIGHPGATDLMRVLAKLQPAPDWLADTLIEQTRSAQADTVAAGYAELSRLAGDAVLARWVPGAVADLSDPARALPAARALREVAGRTAMGMPELARLATGAAPEATRLVALQALAQASDGTKSWPPAVRAAAKPAALEAYAEVLARAPVGELFEAAVAALRFTERDSSLAARAYLKALQARDDPPAQASLLRTIGQAHGDAGALADALRPYADSANAEVRATATQTLDAIRPSWRESGQRAERVAAGTATAPAAPAPGAKPADGLRVYAVVKAGDVQALARLVTRDNVNVRLAFSGQSAGTPTPLGGIVQHCGLPQVAPDKLVAAARQLLALGADPTQEMSDGMSILDYAKFACTPEVQAVLAQ